MLAQRSVDAGQQHPSDAIQGIHIDQFFSKHFTLLPGDIILTGTPHGVGAFRDPSVYMKDGDKVVVDIDAIGRLVNRCRTRENDRE